MNRALSLFMYISVRIAVKVGMCFKFCGTGQKQVVKLDFTLFREKKKKKKSPYHPCGINRALRSAKTYAAKQICSIMGCLQSAVLIRNHTR